MEATTNCIRPSLALHWYFGVLIAILHILSTAHSEEPQSSDNRFTNFPQVTNPESGISWPAGQAIPIFATPAKTLDTLEVQQLSVDEQLMFAALQGIVNRQQPRIYLLDARADEGRDTWAKTSTVAFQDLNAFDRRTKYQLVAKYADEISGVVLYDPTQNEHYRNLASTVAGLHRAIPVTKGVFELLQKAGISLTVVVDLTSLRFGSPTEIYEHLLETYWPQCEKRLLVSARPDTRGGDHHHTRDLAAACRCAVVWLDGREPEERELMRKFYQDMPSGNAFVLGWHATERSGISLASEYAIATLPSDHFISATVYAGGDHRIVAPPVPKMQPLQNKAYIAIFLSDGDNIQYNQRAMRKIWDSNAVHRGKMPLNWTISPALVDVAPGMLNYYYSTATASDCFVTGPSGMGYLMPFNTLIEPGAPLGEYLSDPARMEAYARTTETYLQRAGLRVMTIWDDASPMQRNAYEKACRNLYGATVQNFKDVPAVESSVINNRVRFEKLVIPYAGTLEHIGSSARNELRKWDGQSPLFLAYQVDIWGELRPEKLLEFQQQCLERFPNQVEFVRADHFFNRFNEANGLDYNLAIADATQVSASSALEALGHLTDGTVATHWESGGTNAEGNDAEGREEWIRFAWERPHVLTRYVLRHSDWFDATPADGVDIEVSVSDDGNRWERVHTCRPASSVSDYDLTPVVARHVQLKRVAPARTKKWQLADVELYGRASNP